MKSPWVNTHLTKASLEPKQTQTSKIQTKQWMFARITKVFEVFFLEKLYFHSMVKYFEGWTAPLLVYPLKTQRIPIVQCLFRRYQLVKEKATLRKQTALWNMKQEMCRLTSICLGNVWAGAKNFNTGLEFDNIWPNSSKISQKRSKGAIGRSKMCSALTESLYFNYIFEFLVVIDTGVVF